VRCVASRQRHYTISGSNYSNGDWSSAVSLGMLLVFLCGLCVGKYCLSSFHFQRAASAARLCAAGTRDRISGHRSSVLVPFVAQVYASHGGRGLPGFLFRGLICAACLFPATVLMGATLPALARLWTPHLAACPWLGPVLRANTLGAVFGCLLTGFYLLRIHDLHTAAYVAAALNGTMALGAFSTFKPVWAVDGGARLSLAGRAGFGTSGALSAPAIRLQRSLPADDFRGYGLRVPCSRTEQEWSVSRSPCQDYARLAPKWSGQGCCH